MVKKGKKTSYIDLGAIQFRKLRKGSIEWCSNEHLEPKSRNKRSPNAGTRKNAMHVVLLLGRPTAYLCSECKREWIKIWKEYSPIEYI